MPAIGVLHPGEMGAAVAAWCRYARPRPRSASPAPCAGSAASTSKNAVSPQTAHGIGDVIISRAGSFVDGGIIGPPPREPGTTRFYLSGPAAGEVAAAFAGSPLEALVVSARRATPRR
jgi:hypothetical protein